ncbi:MAG: MBL fold metallo-hydrolase [Clostridiales bacterium]|nr:MBL fold metallo-hydrolase [Clostridiales bacterium]
MKKTYITKMPDQAGAFLEASRIISSVGANITRVSYNKAVDTHTLFIDVEGTAKQLDCISEGLIGIGYILNEGEDAQVMLLEFVLRDVPGAVLPVLEVISKYRFNISYISSAENGTGYQNFKMGLFVEHPKEIQAFLQECSALCEIRVIEYDESERVLDNTVFYMGFANRLAKKLGLDRHKANELMTHSNLVMQMLDERSEPPYKTFDYIGRFAEMLVQHRGEAFKPVITRHNLSDGFILYCIQPPCGSNTYIYRKDNALLFVDSGFACYAKEMYRIFMDLFPGFEDMDREIMITHPDMDHCGLLNLFDVIHVSPEAAEHFEAEVNGRANFREQNPAHMPYCNISRILSGYIAPELSHLRVISGCEDDPAKPVSALGSMEFAGRRFDFYRGNGGHARGEVVIVDTCDKLVFSGDIAVNAKGFTKPQAAFNLLAPYLMTSVNMDSAKASEERKAMFGLFSPEEYIYCCGHGTIMDGRIDKSPAFDTEIL